MCTAAQTKKIFAEIDRINKRLDNLENKTAKSNQVCDICGDESNETTTFKFESWSRNEWTMRTICSDCIDTIEEG